MIPWNDEMHAMLIDHWKRGYAASQSARIIGETYNHVVSRNAIIGKRSRMGLVRNLDPKLYNTTKAERIAKQSATYNARKRLKRAEKMAALKASKARDAEVKRLREAVKHAQETEKEVPIAVMTTYTRDAVVGLKRNQCRFPIGIVGAPDFHFCHEVKDDGSSYCAHHRAICSMKVPLKMKVA